jgi:CobQ-like glutamine amidotransferase family enzyme
VSRDSEVVVVLVYPELLGTYGDRGNALALARRAHARNLACRVLELSVGDPLPVSADVYLIGGSEDAAQLLALRSFLHEKQVAHVLHDGAATLAVCAGFQILSRSFAGADGHREPGLGLLDVTCGRLPGARAVGEVVAEAVGIPTLPMLTGYENHQGDAVLGPGARPLGRILHGVGNGVARTEGAVQDNVVGTYLHGPVLVRNPALADHLLERATGPLPAYHDEAVEQLRRERLAAAHGFRAGTLRAGQLAGRRRAK